jgi:DNA polymerase elongation subunit (family B)
MADGTPAGRRLFVVDIETVALDPTDEKGALDALTGRVVCVGVLIVDGRTIIERALIHQDERHLIEQFWALLRPTDLLVGHNILDFDLPFLRQRSWILGIKPSRSIDMRRYYTGDVVDTLQFWSNWSYRKMVKLDSLSQGLGCGAKTGNGKDVADWWADGAFDTIGRYCLDDVRITHRVFCRLMYRSMPESVAS